MKHKEYAAGVLTGVLVVTLAAGGVKFVQQPQSNGVLSDSSHDTENNEYLMKMIDQEYLGEVDNAEMARGHLCRSGLRSWRCLFQILYSR